MRVVSTLIYRHRGIVRLAHWVNVVCLAVLLMSGLQIFNAHPALYWGHDSHFSTPLFSLEAGFPGWLTLPGYQDLATGRHWHFLFAWLFVLNGLVYLGAALVQGHLRYDLVPTWAQLRRIGGALVEHARLRLPRARGYNVLQKLSYLAVILVLLPAMVLAGLAMSPALDAALPWLVELFGGRQSARTVHFALAGLIVLFVVVHVLMVLLSGPWNSLRSMITGWYDVGAPR